MSVVSASGSGMPSRGWDDDSDIPGGRGVLWVVTGACVIVVVAIVLLLVVQPGKKSAPPKLCYDSAMQMEMPCTTGP
jgi:hypothetical protein